MGIAVSDWRLARTVSQLGHLGVVSGTAINSVLIRRLQSGDPGGHVRRALAAFPFPESADRIRDKYLLSEAPTGAFARSLLFSIDPSIEILELNVVASFVESHLALEGHDGWVGLNLLEKIQMPNLSALYGAMLAGVDCVLMGAGIPREIPGALDKLASHDAAQLKIAVAGLQPDDPAEWSTMTFDPVRVFPNCKELGELHRPLFFPIVSSSVLAQSLKRKANGRVDGFVVEGPRAGGHNAPPRGALQLSEIGEPIYGARDQVELSEMKALGLPFWVAGDQARPERMRAAIEQGAHGVQVGTLFAFCDESGLSPSLRSEVIRRVAQSEGPINGWVFTDPVSSPTGFPFKAVRMDGTLSESEVYEGRRRICDLGYLREAYRKPEGGVGYRCSAEPLVDYIKKGGAEEDTKGKKCLCNALMADIDLAQRQKWGVELPLLTAGDDLNELNRILRGRLSYSAKDVLEYLQAALPADEAVEPVEPETVAVSLQSPGLSRAQDQSPGLL
jgi:NAD(P)H-dependent flavin oxidoreductase YrpB (nitropropane dioxygenase family)